jgi:cytochrome c553
VGGGYKGCSSCHKIGAKASAEEKYKYRYGNAQCDSCHTRHTFKKSEALDPRACQTCHMGFDHPQWEMWSTSKHGTIWQIEGNKSKRAPTCQTCHMQNGDHGVMTAWGFLALRLPEDDKDWMNDRVTILQGLGVLDEKGTPTARLDVVKAGKVARLSKEEFQKERQKMLAVCTKCHGASYAKEQLDAADMVIKDVDKIMAEAIREVQGLYRDGILKKPAGWTFAPDLLQFYEARSSVEQDLYVMFLEYRMRAFQGAFHMNPDYMHWYGWAPMKETLQKVKDEANKLRAEKPAAGAQH